jgi:archaellum component FlaF (FlaF/FlaG flagellin family)
MGFSTAAVFAILFVIGMAAVVQLLTMQDEYAVTVGHGARDIFERHSKETRSNIEITNVTYSGGDIVITVNNTGNVALDLAYVYLVINDTWIPEDNYTVTLIHSPSSGYWEPTESIEINYTATQDDWTVKVVVETGIEDRYEFVV